MTKTKSYCDHCGKELDEMVDFNCITIDIYTSWKMVDLCESCHNKLWSLIKKFCDGEVTEK